MFHAAESARQASICTGTTTNDATAKWICCHCYRHFVGMTVTLLQALLQALYGHDSDTVTGTVTGTVMGTLRA